MPSGSLSDVIVEASSSSLTSMSSTASSSGSMKESEAALASKDSLVDSFASTFLAAFACCAAFSFSALRSSFIQFLSC